MTSIKHVVLIFNPRDAFARTLRAILATQMRLGRNCLIAQHFVCYAQIQAAHLAVATKLSKEAQDVGAVA